MPVFSNYDIHRRREAAHVTVAELAAFVGKEVGTIYNWEHGKCDPTPDDMYLVAVLLDDLNIWYDWMRTKYPGSYGRLHPDGNPYDLRGSLMMVFPEMAELLAIQHAAERDAADGVIDDPVLKSELTGKVNAALASLQRLANALMTK